LERALKFLESLIKILRGAAAVAISSLPAFFSNVFSDINPAIIENIWSLTLLVSLGAGAVFYVAFRKSASSQMIIIVGILLFAACLVCAALVLAIALQVFSISSAMNAWIARLAFIGFFASLAGCLSMLVAQVVDEWTAMFSSSSQRQN
jgi:hypothetical protein